VVSMLEEFVSMLVVRRGRWRRNSAWEPPWDRYRLLEGLPLSL
jgi:hypothetical protein